MWSNMSMRMMLDLPVAAESVGLTCRQIDHWRRAGAVPGLPGDPCDGDTVLACLLTRDLLHAGANLDRIQSVLSVVWDAGPDVASQAVAVCSGERVQLVCTTDALLAALNTGAGVIIVSVARAWAATAALFATATPVTAAGEPGASPAPRRLRVVA